MLKASIIPEKVLPYFAQLLDGVEAAHLQGIIHRDLKPENVLYDAVGDKLIIGDFGIAHFEEDELYTAAETSDHDRLANFLYSAPEQRLRGQLVDHRADIYALDLILNESYTGEVPQGSQYRKIAEVVPSYAYLDDLVDRMIRQNGAGRPDSIAKIKEELIARKNEFVVQQRLSTLRQTVIPDTDLDDPHITDPIRLVGFDYTPGGLTLELSRPVNDLWRWAFRNFGSHSAVHGKGPERFVLEQNAAQIPASEHDVEDVVKHFKDWLPAVNRTYEQEARRRKQVEKEKRKLELQRKIAHEEERARVLAKLKV